MSEEKILLSHGSGGEPMQELIQKLFLKKFANPVLAELTDSAYLVNQKRIAFTTDSFIVTPLFFPGADIGKLAVCGTVNDLVVSGALPEYLSLALIIEEGLEYRLLERITDSIACTARGARVGIVTGDFKVVEKGACDKVFINTSGIGKIITPKKLSTRDIVAGDKIIITGNIARHGLAVLSKRKELGFDFGIKSDCAALQDLIIPVLKQTRGIKFMRDPTRGGVATTLNEIARACQKGIIVDERLIPVSPRVRAACEMLGLDPLYIANEGRALLVVEAKESHKIIDLLKRNPLGRNAKIIGEVVNGPAGQVVLDTVTGSRRILEMLAQELLPRIC